jgi:hypothetical protein
MVAGLRLTEQFILLFNNLKNAAGGNPQRVRTFYKDSELIRRSLHALDTFLDKTDLERRVFHGPQKLILQVPAEFEAAWNEYDSEWRFQQVLDPSWGLEEILDPTLLPEVEQRPTEESIPGAPDPEEEDSFDPLLHDGGAAIQLGIEQLEIEAQNEAIDDYTERVINSCRIACGAYDYLTQTIGLNIPEIFRRWRRAPVIFMPAHVSNRYGASDRGSLLHLLDDAVRAYIFGAPAAAIAMCRAALEMVLKRHYGRGQWEDAKLGNLITLASQRYDFIQEKRITPLVQRANRIVHDYTKVDRLSDEDDRTILIFLKTVKFLIQRAPGR